MGSMVRSVVSNDNEGIYDRAGAGAYIAAWAKTHDVPTAIIDDELGLLWSNTAAGRYFNAGDVSSSRRDS